MKDVARVSRMDIKREPKGKTKRNLYIALGAAALIVVTFLLSRLEPAAPTVDRNVIVQGTVERGEMVREVRGSGTLVPERVQFVAAVTAGRVESVHFEPGQEMQHDTSPHDLVQGGKRRRVQTASLVLCYSRMLFFQVYPRFTRFDCKVFLTEALRYLGGACDVCMIDNTHLVVLKGTGVEMIPVPGQFLLAPLETEQGVDPGQQFPVGHRPDDVLVGAPFQPLSLLIRFGPEAGHQGHKNIGGGRVGLEQAPFNGTIQCCLQVG